MPVPLTTKRFMGRASRLGQANNFNNIATHELLKKYLKTKEGVQPQDRWLRNWQGLNNVQNFYIQHQQLNISS